MDGEELAVEMAESVNSGVDSSELVEQLSSEHRYLQQEVFRQIVKPVILEYARMAENGDYDKRNKSTVMTCKEIADEMDWHY